MKRFAYLTATILLLGVEVLIALKVNDDIVCYGVGCALLGLFEIVRGRHKISRKLLGQDD